MPKWMSVIPVGPNLDECCAVWSSIMRHLHGNPSHLHMIKTAVYQHIMPNEPLLSHLVEEKTSSCYCVWNDTEDWRGGSKYSKLFPCREETPSSGMSRLLLCMLNIAICVQNKAIKHHYKLLNWFIVIWHFLCFWILSGKTCFSVRVLSFAVTEECDLVVVLSASKVGFASVQFHLLLPHLYLIYFILN